MKLTALTLISLLGLTTAAPTPTPEEKRWPSDPTLITPTYISTYNINTGALTYAPPTGLSSFAETTSTISTFSIPAGLSGQKCRLGFHISEADAVASVAPGTGVQVFSTNSVPPAHDVASWGPPGNQRNQHFGNLKIVNPGEATVDDWPRLLERFDCPEEGLWAWEVVAKWEGSVEWDPEFSGLYVQAIA